MQGLIFFENLWNPFRFHTDKYDKFSETNRDQRESYTTYVKNSDLRLIFVKTKIFIDWELPGPTFEGKNDG